MEFFLVGFLIATMIGGALAYRCYETRSSIVKRSHNQKMKLIKELEDLKSSSEHEIESLKEDVDELKGKVKEFKHKVDSLQDERARLTAEVEKLKAD